MKTRLLLSLALCWGGIGPVRAQPTDALAAAQDKMAIYLGTWDFKAHGVDTPFQKAADWHGVVSGDWFPGHYGVVRHNQMTGPSGKPTQIIQMLAYDKTRDSYRLFEVTEDGFVAAEDVTISGQTMVANHDQIMRGKMWHVRWTLTMVDANHRHYLREYSEDGITWLPSWVSDETRR